MVKQKSSAPSNTKIAIVFCVFVVFVVVFSLLLKGVILMRNSHFDSSKRFTLGITNGRNTEIMSLSPSKDIVIYKLKNKMTPKEAGQLLEIPIDGFINSNSLDLDQKPDTLFMNLVSNYNNINTNLTVVDLLKIAALTKMIPENSINIEIVGDTDELDLNKIVGHLVSDSFMEKDNQTIQIVNATGVGGLGNRLARLITNMGGNAIIVATGNSISKKSTISYIDKKTYTIEKLQKVLGYEVKKEEGNAVADITIVIGEDKVSSEPF
jgi:hypothetical protein